MSGEGVPTLQSIRSKYIDYFILLVSVNRLFI
jgi:hypothetical protein